jgi:hypothetical protein
VPVAPDRPRVSDLDSIIGSTRELWLPLVEKTPRSRFTSPQVRIPMNALGKKRMHEVAEHLSEAYPRAVNIFSARMRAPRTGSVTGVRSTS